MRPVEIAVPLRVEGEHARAFHPRPRHCGMSAPRVSSRYTLMPGKDHTHPQTRARHGVFQHQPGPVPLGNALHDGQAQAAAGLVRSGRTPKETIEDPLPVRRADTRSRITYRQPGAFSPAPHIHIHLPTGGGEAQGIVHQIGQQDVQGPRIPRDGGGGLATRQSQIYASGPGQRGTFGDDPDRQGV